MNRAKCLRWSENGVLFSLLLYALAACLSIAVANIAVSVGALFAVIYYCIKRPAFFLPVRPILSALGIFLLAMLGAAMVGDSLATGAERWQTYFFRMLPFFLCVGFVRKPEQRFRLMWLLFGSIFIADLYAIYQGVQGNWRATAFGSHPMILAGFLVQLLPCILVFGVETETRRARVGLTCLFVLSNAALLYNGTRGAWMAALLTYSIFALLLLRRSCWKKGAAILAALLLLSGFAWSVAPLHDRLLTLTDQQFQSNAERQLMWQSAWRMFLDHPGLGVGLGQYEQHYLNEYISPLAKERLGHAHNNFMQMLAETGSVGFFAFCLLFGVILQQLWRQHRQHHSLWAMAVLLATIALLLQGLTEFNFGNSAVSRLFWFLLGIAASEMEKTEQEISGK